MAPQDNLNLQLKRINEVACVFSSEAIKYVGHFNEEYHVLDRIKKRPIILVLPAIFLFIFIAYPLMTVWVFACIGTGYPAYKIFASFASDREKEAQAQKAKREMTEFIDGAIRDGRIIQLPITRNSKLIERSVIICGQSQSVIKVKDPDTGIQSTYPWDVIDVENLHKKYVSFARN